MRILLARWKSRDDWNVEFKWSLDHDTPPNKEGWVRIGTDADIDGAMKTLDVLMAGK